MKDYFYGNRAELSHLRNWLLKEVGDFTPIMLLDAEGRFIYASAQFLQDMGLDADGLYEKTAYDLLDGNFYDHSPSLKALRENKDTAEVSYDKRGALVYTETRIIRNSDNSIRFILCHSIKPDIIAREINEMRRQIDYYRDRMFEIENDQLYPNKIVYGSDVMQSTLTDATKIAAVESTVLITGESGVGKDLLARHIHDHSNRWNKPFVPICIPMIAPSLLESELFGYTKGAFTGSSQTGKVGLFEAANGGTVFLDEIGDIPLELQVKLLRVLENREIMRIGSTEPIKLDIRIISATNQDLFEMIHEKKFREDLFYRIGIIRINIPPLRDRKGDASLLANHFLKTVNSQYNMHKRFSESALKELEQYEWPGNVRQLKNIVEQSAVLSDSDLISPQEILRILPESNLRFTPKDLPQHQRSAVSAVKRSSEDRSRQRIIDALAEASGNKKKAAQILGISRGTLYRKMEKYHISADYFKL